jgi:hypothetical protein
MKDNLGSNQPTETGNTLLHITALKGSVKECIKYFAITNIDPTNANGETPLHIAAKHGKLGNVKCLLDLGANVYALDKDGNTPLHSAVSVGNQYYDVLFTPYIIEHLIGRGVDINAQNFNGFEPLHSAAEFGNPAILTCLLKLGSNINVETAQGLTPVLLALHSRNLQNAEFLLSKGANTTISDFLKSAYPEHVERIKSNFSMLIQSSEDPVDHEFHEESTEIEHKDAIFDQMLENNKYYVMKEDDASIFSTLYNINATIANIFTYEFYRLKGKFSDFTATINSENDSIDFLGNPSFIFDEESDY